MHRLALLLREVQAQNKPTTDLLTDLISQE